MIQYLWEDHPDILSGYLRGRDIEVPEEWYEDINKMLLELEFADPTCRVLQIKTKFGSLRVYVEMEKEKISVVNEILTRYENLLRSPHGSKN